MSGLYELFEMHTPDHAVVSETVNATRQLRKAWAKGLVNAILRNARRQQTRLRQGAEQDVQARTLHPQWLLDHLQQDWPQDWPEIVAQNNLPAPMTLRLDLQHASRDPGCASRIIHTGRSTTGSRGPDPLPSAVCPAV
ncbi:MAG: transcription antitermination factor NusB, partial [Gammaproteobacteria bacterium]